MTNHLYHAPADCPVCGDDLIITRKGCLKCGTELAGEFASCAFCALDDTDREILTVFLASRGNLREVEKHLGVSYPTARARFDAVLVKLGLRTAVGEEPGARESEEGAEAVGAADAQAGPSGDVGDEPPVGSYGSAQEQILARVASGELPVDVAAQLILGL